MTAFESDKTRAAVDKVRKMLSEGISIQATGEATNAVVRGALEACMSHIGELEADFTALRAAVAYRDRLPMTTTDDAPAPEDRTRNTCCDSEGQPCSRCLEAALAYTRKDQPDGK